MGGKWRLFINTLERTGPSAEAVARTLRSCSTMENSMSYVDVFNRKPYSDIIYSSLRAVMVICTTSLVTLAGYAPAVISVPPLNAFSFQLFSTLPATGT